MKKLQSFKGLNLLNNLSLSENFKNKEINVGEDIEKIDLTNISPEDRNGSQNPSISRYDFGTFYAYEIDFYKGCSCGYLGCDSYELVTSSLKLRRKDNEKIILTRKGTTKVKLSINKKYNTEDIKQLIIKYY